MSKCKTLKNWLVCTGTSAISLKVRQSEAKILATNSDPNILESRGEEASSKDLEGLSGYFQVSEYTSSQLIYRGIDGQSVLTTN